jgi:hypothetical protein
MVGSHAPKGPQPGTPSQTVSHPPVAAQSQAPPFGRMDAPPDMPRYAPQASPTGQLPAQVADRRALEASGAPIGQSQIPAARFQNTIDTPNMEPSYDGTRSRLR